MLALNESVDLNCWPQTSTYHLRFWSWSCGGRIHQGSCWGHASGAVSMSPFSHCSLWPFSGSLCAFPATPNVAFLQAGVFLCGFFGWLSPPFSKQTFLFDMLSLVVFNSCMWALNHFQPQTSSFSWFFLMVLSSLSKGDIDFVFVYHFCCSFYINNNNIKHLLLVGYFIRFDKQCGQIGPSLHQLFERKSYLEVARLGYKMLKSFLFFSNNVGSKVILRKRAGINVSNVNKVSSKVFSGVNF